MCGRGVTRVEVPQAHGFATQDQVERGLGGAAHAREAAVAQHRGDARLAGLRAEAGAALLRQRARRADERREAGVDVPDRGQVLLDRVAGERLDDEAGAVAAQRRAGAGGGGGRVAEVVEESKKAIRSYACSPG